MIKIKEMVDYLKQEKIQMKLINLDENKLIEKIINNFENSDENSILWLNNKNIEKIELINEGTVICCDINMTEGLKISNKLSLIIVENPKKIFSIIMKKFFAESKIHKIEIELHSKIKLGKNVHIGKGTILKDNCEIGDNTYIGHNNVILENTIIGSNVSIGHNNTIGEVGFGYEKDDEGNYYFIPHIGNVVIEDFVEIGNNNCIDRAVLGSTILKKNCKIDNLVHIAHGVIIGENSLIIANSMIAGSVDIGKNCWIAPSTSIINKLSIGENSMTGIGAVVIKPIGNNELHIGVPSKKIRNI